MAEQRLRRATSSPSLSLDAMDFDESELDYLLSQSEANLSDTARQFTAEELHLAVIKENVALTRFILLHSAGVDVHSKNEEGHNCLHVAVELSNLDLVKAMLHHGVDVNDPTIDCDASALHFAVSCMNYCAVWYLYTDEYKKVLENKYVEMVYLLLAHGANPNAKDRSGWTPLHLAARNLNKMAASCDVIRLLVKHGAEISRLDRERFTPFYHALFQDNLDGAKCLVDLAIDAAAQKVCFARYLMESFYAECDQLVDYLLRLGADMEAKDRQGSSLLHRALLRLLDDEHCYKVVRMMLQKGAEFRQCDRASVAQRRLDTVEVYLEELQRMRTTRICKTVRTTYYDLLTKRGHSLVACLRSKRLHLQMHSDDFANMFPNFFFLMQVNYAHGYKKMIKFNRMYGFLSEIMSGSLPREIIYMLCKYFSDQDIKSILGSRAKLVRV